MAGESLILPGVYGDVDGDGEVDESDALAVLEEWGATAATSTKMGDLNNDGIIGAADLTILLQQLGFTAEMLGGIDLEQVVEALRTGPYGGETCPGCCMGLHPCPWGPLGGGGWWDDSAIPIGDDGGGGGCTNCPPPSPPEGPGGDDGGSCECCNGCASGPEGCPWRICNPGCSAYVAGSWRITLRLACPPGSGQDCWASIENQAWAGQAPATQADPGPDYAVVVWTNTDDDDSDGVLDAERLTGATDLVEMPREDELYEITRVGNFCRADRPCNRWTIEGHGAEGTEDGVRIWYRFSGGEDPVIASAVSPWAPEGMARMVIGGFEYRQLPADQWLSGNPNAVETTFFVEVRSPGLKSVVFRFLPCGREAWERRGILRLAAIGMDVYDLRGWGAGVNGAGTPQVTHPISGPPMGSSPDAWKVGGAITDGASICLLRVERPEGSLFEGVDSLRIEVVKALPAPVPPVPVPGLPPPGPGHPGGFNAELSRRAGGTIVGFVSDPFSLPLLPVTEQWLGDLADLPSVGHMDQGNVFFVSPESYLDPQHNPGAGTNALNSGETCAIAFRAALPDPDDPYNQHAFSPIPGSRCFMLRRPPVVLVHGVTSSPGVWDRNKEYEAGAKGRWEDYDDPPPGTTNPPPPSPPPRRSRSRWSTSATASSSPTPPIRATGSTSACATTPRHRIPRPAATPSSRSPCPRRTWPTIPPRSSRPRRARASTSSPS